MEELQAVDTAAEETVIPKKFITREQLIAFGGDEAPRNEVLLQSYRDHLHTLARERMNLE